jgi:hypothetical protein
LLIVKLPEFELRIREGRAIQLWLLDRAELLLFAVIPIGVARQQRLAVGDL